MYKKIYFLLFIVSLAGFTASFAQNTYPAFDEDSYVENVKIKGQKPTIVDFVNNFLREPEDELSGSLNDMWKRHLAGKPQKKGCKVTLDVRNGYVKFEDEDKESDTYSVSEMCYWNCADQKHKIVAFSNNLYTQGRYVEGQYTGVSFFLYENSSRRLMVISAADIGAEIDSGHSTNGYDGTNWFVEKDGKKHIMSEQEYWDWYENSKPVFLYHLPQKGKDLTIESYTPRQVLMKVYTWDGYRFHSPDNK